MFVIIPFISLGAIYFFVAIRLKDSLFDWRSQFLFSSLLWGVILLLGTEFLGCFQLLSFYPVLFFWIFIAVLFICISFSSKDKFKETIPNIKTIKHTRFFC